VRVEIIRVQLAALALSQQAAALLHHGRREVLDLPWNETGGTYGISPSLGELRWRGKRRVAGDGKR
jgi:hypothetical protein